MTHKPQFETQARFSIGDSYEKRYIAVAAGAINQNQTVFEASPLLGPGEQVNLSDTGSIGVEGSKGQYTITSAELPQGTSENRQARPRILAMLALTAFADHFTSLKEANKTRVTVAPSAAEEIGEGELRLLKMRKVTRRGEVKHFSASARRLHAYGAVMLRKTDAIMLPKNELVHESGH